MGRFGDRHRDSLTGLYDRRFFEKQLTRGVASAHRYDRALTLIVFDVDDFKTVNDKVGHLAGDAVLAGVAQRISGVGRDADIACRVGGDEFAVILPESTAVDAEDLYRRLEAALDSWRTGDEQLGISAGIAELIAGDDATSLVRRADEALYRAKGSGPWPPPPSGVREPRRPKPSGGGAHVSRRLDEDDVG